MPRRIEILVTRTPVPAADGGRRGRATPRPIESETNAAASGHVLSDERVVELRRRVRDGEYRNPAVLEQVARRIVERGEL